METARDAAWLVWGCQALTRCLFARCLSRGANRVFRMWSKGWDNRGVSAPVGSNPFAPGGAAPGPGGGGGRGPDEAATGPMLGRGSELQKVYYMPHNMGHNDGVNCISAVISKLLMKQLSCALKAQAPTVRGCWGGSGMERERERDCQCGMFTLETEAWLWRRTRSSLGVAMRTFSSGVRRRMLLGSFNWCRIAPQCTWVPASPPCAAWPRRWSHRSRV